MLIDHLEPRRLLSTIVWTNRGQLSDRFTEVFGAQANVARAVIDEAIDRWERVISDFNYTDGSNTYSLQVAMRASGTGLGGQAGTDPITLGKPSSGTLVLDRGTDGAGAGWYLDPVPTDDAEFTGTVHNAFSASATNGTTPFAKADMLTVAMHEIGHCLGLSSNAAMNAFATNTGVADTGGAFLWAFEGPSVSHLFTGFDTSGTVHNGTQHSAAVDDEIFFDGQTWSGVNDLMNAVGQTSRRKLIDNVVAWALSDAWDYDIALPENFGTFYSTLNRSTGQLLVRGDLTAGGNASDDDIEIGLLFGVLVVSVDIGQDVPGTGPLPGPGNVDAFVSLYNPADVTSIIMNAGDGNDTIAINSFTSATTGVNIDAGDGNDTITLGGGDLDTNLLAPIAIVGAGGTDALILNDTTDGLGSDSYTFTATALNKPVGEVISWLQTENVTLNASPNNDVITVNGTLPSVALRVNARAGNDTINIQNTDLFSPVTITSGDGDLDVVNVNTDDTANALAVFPTSDTVDAINIGIGGRLALGGAVVPNSFLLVTRSLSIDNGGVLDLTNNSMVLDHPAGPSPYVTIRNLIASARAGGAWTGSGITSFGAFLANPKNTTLGLLTSGEYFQIYGFGADFAGYNIDIHAICIKYTYYGDTDLNGAVNFDDYSRTDLGFNQSRTGWMNGDFDGNGVINFDDYSLIDLAFNTQGVVLARTKA